MSYWLNNVKYLSTKAAQDIRMIPFEVSSMKVFASQWANLRETLFKTEDEIGGWDPCTAYFATEIGHKDVQILLKLAETLT